MIPREVILKKASELITGDRDKEYGDAFTNFNDIAQGWSLILKKHVTREDVALCMAWVKMARLAKNPTHQDSWVDIAGYAGLGGEIGSMDASTKIETARQQDVLAKVEAEVDWQL